MAEIKSFVLRIRNPELARRLDEAVKESGKKREPYVLEVIERHLDELDISAAVRPDEVANVPPTHMLAGARISRSPGASGGASAQGRASSADHSGPASGPVDSAPDPGEVSGNSGSSQQEEIEF